MKPISIEEFREFATKHNVIPVAESFKQMAEAGHDAPYIAQNLPHVADVGLESTRPLLATKGRAAGLGERAIGHLDAGAKSCQVIIHAICQLIISHHQPAD